MSDDGNIRGATPSHQQETQDINTKLWGSGQDGDSPGKFALPIPPHVEAGSGVMTKHNEDMPGVEGGAIPGGSGHKEAVTQAMMSITSPCMSLSRGPWEVVEEIETKHLYPAKHPFIRTMTNSDNPNKMPYSITTTSFLLYKKNYMHFILGDAKELPVGFKHNCGTDYIHYPITQPYGETAQAQYMQTILGPNPIIVVLHNDTDKVYSKLLYA